MMHWDMPYGKGLADWDAALLTDMEVESLFQQLGVINRARNHCLVLGCVWHDVGRMRTTMAANGYLDIHPLFVYKPMQNTSGMESGFRPSKRSSWATRVASRHAI